MPRVPDFSRSVAKLRALVPGIDNKRSKLLRDAHASLPGLSYGQVTRLASNLRWLSKTELNRWRSREPLLTDTRLREISHALKYCSQQEFADLVGVTASCIQSLELGKRPVTKELALKMYSATGVDPASVMARTEALRGWDGLNYNITSYNRWLEINRLADEGDARMLAADFAATLELLIVAAHRRRNFPLSTIRVSLIEDLVRTAETLGLKDQIVQMIRQGDTEQFDPMFLQYAPDNLHRRDSWLRVRLRKQI